MTARDDLAHLSPEALVQLTNAGLVKRAVRELAAGYRPQLVLDADGTLQARFNDGVATTWPRGLPIQRAACSCGAAGVCRHRLIAVLAWREHAPAAEAQAPAPVESLGDDALTALVPAAVLQAAAQQRDAGIAVDIRRTASGEPCDTARLPAATVRYWAGAALEAARCDCIRASLCEHVVLGLWAFRAAPAAAATATVRLGPPAAAAALDAAPLHACVAALLQHGVVQGTGPLTQGLTAARAAAAPAAWLALLVDELEAWAEAYAARSSLYEAVTGVDLVAELALRLAAGRQPGQVGSALGLGQAAETALDRLRLMCLGARTRRDGERRRTSLVMADLDTGTRLVLHHDWLVPEARAADEATLRAAERLAPGVRLEALAGGQLLAQQAARRADGSLRLARARSAQNSVLPQAADWALLGPPVRFASVAALRAEAQAHPSPALQPRHAARRFIVFSPEAVGEVVYDANEQALLALLTDAEGQTLLLQRQHERHAPHALDAIAAALSGRGGALRHVAGLLHWRDGLPVIEPWALATDALVVPDFAAPAGALAALPLGRAALDEQDPCQRQLRQLKEHLATLLHHGRQRVPARWAAEGRLRAAELASAGLPALAAQLRALQAALAEGADSTEPAQRFMALAALCELHEDAARVSGL